MNLVYKYGLRPPTIGAERVAQQMRRAHDYRNQLTELERQRRDRIRHLDMVVASEQYEAVRAAAEELEEAVEAVRRERASTRKLSETSDARQRVKDARAELRTARKAWGLAIRAAKEATQPARDAAQEWFLAARREARPGLTKSPEGVAAGTYQLVEESVSQAAAAPLWADAEPNDPKFARWTGEGFVSQQIVGGLSVDDIADDTQVRVVPVEDTRPPSMRRSRKVRCELWLRVGSTPTKAPVWAVWPMVLHRPLPAGARIQRATVRKVHVGPREEWSVEFSLRCMDPLPKMGDAIAIDIGWRQMRDGTLRLACTYDQHGAEREYRLPGEVYGGITFPQGIRATRDLNFDAARARLVGWLASTADIGWLKDATETLSQWRAQARLASLVIRWRASRLPGDDAIFAELDAWRVQDRHLWLWETSQRTGGLRTRKDWYRRQAAELADKYAVLVLEKFDLRRMARLPLPETGENVNETANANRVVAALSEFRTVLRSAFAMRGGRIVEVDATNTTRACAVCGVVETFDAAAMLRHKCQNGHEWDQDENAAKNIYERFRETPEPGDARTPDGPDESRRDRVSRLRADKEARMERSKAAAETPFGLGLS
jgi:putative transposase